jgi:hypothetical protein
MKTLLSSGIPPESRRIVTAFTFTVSILVGGLFLGHPATAGAEPNSEWDIEAYDNCMSKTVRDAEYCCVISGGNVTRDGACVAPAAVATDDQSGSPHDPGPRINEGMLPKPPTAFELPAG